jgi:Xaa-Pro aminopeptidase
VNDRIARLQALLDDPLLLTDGTNVRYLTGFESSNCALLVEQERTRLFTDFRYAEAARDVPDVELVITRRNLIGELAEMLDGRIAFERVLPYGLYEVLRDGGLDLVPTGGTVESLRAVKDEQELDALRRACAITDRVFERLSQIPFVGRTEREVSWDLTQLFVAEGGEGLAFESIVGAGPTGARPHARAGDRRIGEGELVVIDAGTTIDGYASDYTRTFATGDLDAEAREAYDTVLAAQQAALDGLKAGLSGFDADALARNVIDGSAFNGKLGHGLGHGLGLDVHEAPKLSTESTDTLVAGNVVTVEPGIYVDGRFGIRIEDDVVITDGGIENLTGFRKDIVRVA